MLLAGNGQADPGMRTITRGRVTVSCKLPAPALPDLDFVTAPPSIEATIDLVAKRAVVSSNNGIGGSMGPIKLDLSDTGHQSARALINPANGWMAIVMTTVDAKNSDLHEFKLYLQRSSDTAPYRILDVVHGGYNPVSGMAHGYLGLDVFKSRTCNVAISGQ